MFDSSTQRMFVSEQNRILVYAASPDQLSRWPAASYSEPQIPIAVIGQPDFTTTESPRKNGLTPRRPTSVGSFTIDQPDQRLFVEDSAAHRVLVFDMHPDRLNNDPEAFAVIGQEDFNGREPGIGPAKFTNISDLTYDADLKRLFVGDDGNNRVMVFDVDPKRPDGMKQALAVMGQTDFYSKVERDGMDQIKPGSMGYDWRFHRLFISERLQHRVMVYDTNPDLIGGPATAMAVIGQPDFNTTRPMVSQNRLIMPKRPNVDPINQKLYITEGYPGGNRAAFYDISPENLKSGMAAVDLVGHEKPNGEPDFDNRMAQGHLDGQSLAAARSVELDPADHRLFVGDEYNHRVVVWQLDNLNRIVDYTAQWVLGQPDLNTSLIKEPTSQNMTVPLAVSYDKSSKRLFVADGYHNRVLVYDAAPGQLQNGMAASHVIGQKDFTSTKFTAGKAGTNFEIRFGRGIASSLIPVGLAVDEAGQRLFLSDGKNNRVVVYDVRREILKNAPEAIGVLGQPTFESTTPQAGARGMYDPGHLAFDPVHQRLFVIDYRHKRVLVFDVDRERFENGASAIAVIGQSDFTTTLPPERSPTVDGAHIYSPNGLAFDAKQQLLYVADGGGSRVAADRVLVFDVDPKRLQNGPEAITTLGAPNAESPIPKSWGGAQSYPGQFSLRDTRGITLDAENGRLFTTGSFESRLVAFHFPRSSWQYKVGAGDIQKFGTLDAVDLGSVQDPMTVSTVRLQGNGTKPGSLSLYSITSPFVDERTQRHSRMLISEAALASEGLLREATLFIQGKSGRQHKVYLYNPGRRTSTVKLSLLDQDGAVQRDWEVRVASGNQTLVVPETIGPISEVMSLRVTSNNPVGLVALRETVNRRSETVLSPIPMSEKAIGERAMVVPLFANGGGTRSDLVLVNPTGKGMRGDVTFYDERGFKHNLGTSSDFMGYYLPPYSSQFIPSDGAGPMSENGYVLIESRNEDSVPYAAAMVQRRYGDVWASESLVEGTRGMQTEFALDLRSTPVRHGKMDAQVVMVNTSGAAVQVKMSVGGQQIATSRLEVGEQRIQDLGDAVQEQNHGVLSVESDGYVVVSVQQRTLNLRGEIIEAVIPAITSGDVIPYVGNGGGLSTEIRLINRSNQELTGHLEFYQPDGQLASETILR
jgi:DNA-binding beta-propeller fold protein YncE